MPIFKRNSFEATILPSRFFSAGVNGCFPTIIVHSLEVEHLNGHGSCLSCSVVVVVAGVVDEIVVAEEGVVIMGVEVVIKVVGIVVVGVVVVVGIVVVVVEVVLAMVL